MDNRITAKDLINVGVFTAIYFILFFVTGTIGYIPILHLAVPFLCVFVTGIVFMLFLTKVNKFGMVTIMGLLMSILMLITGHVWVVIPIAIVFSVTADLILKAGNYKKWSHVCLGYVVFSEWVSGLMFPIFFMRDDYFTTLRDGYGDTYTDTLIRVTPIWMFWVIIFLIGVGALCGAYLGKAALKKHFKRAGIA